MASVKIRPVILCGGGGTRLWPLSTQTRPKQFLALAGPRAMVSETALRVSDPEKYHRPLAIGGARHAPQLRAALPGADILLEPVGRNSAPPIAAAALSADRDDLLLILPSDHHIADLDAFQDAIQAGVAPAQNGRIVIFGIEPTRPATGYGYIEEAAAAPALSARAVARFVEKPDRVTAQSYLDAGGFYWNAGIFLFRARTILDALQTFAPDILAGVDRALHDGHLDPALFAAVPARSIDYAVMEHATNIDVVPVSMGWSDLGEFRALHALAAGEDSDAAVLLGPAAATASRRIFVQSTGPRVAVHGLEDIAIVATPDSVLVTRLCDAEDARTAAATVTDPAFGVAGRPVQTWIGDWLWSQVMPRWAELCVDANSGGFVESLDLSGAPQPARPRRGRVAPRQLFSFARARRLGWNPDGRADAVIEAGLAFLDSQGRSSRGGWAHEFDGAGNVTDDRRDFFDHTFVALAGAELAALGDPRGDALASEAFELMDALFLDADHGGWRDCETGDGSKLANPHMHLLEASLAHFDAGPGPGSAARIETICALFEQHMFDARTGAMGEVFTSDWRPGAQYRVEPGHCYEWAYLLAETARLTGRDTASWARRLTGFGETQGVSGGLSVDILGVTPPSFRLWPQLERLRALAVLAWPDADLAALLEDVRVRYLAPGPSHGWIDQLDAGGNPAAGTVPASVIYHLMTGLAPFAPPR